MTGREIYLRALSLLHEQDTDGASYDTASFEASAPECINLLSVLLNELDLHIKGKQTPQNELFPNRIRSLDDEVPLHPVILSGVMPLGLAFLLVSEEDAARASLFFNLFQKEKDALTHRFKQGRRHPITCIY